MKYSVVFSAGLTGNGSVHLNDISILCEGHATQGGWASGLVSTDTLMLVRTTRTIPYFVIKTYKEPKFFSSQHEITYTLPNGRVNTIKFVISQGNNDKNNDFKNSLEQLRNSTKILSGI